MLQLDLPADSFLPLYLFELYALQFVCFPLCSYSTLPKRTPSLCSAPSQPCPSHAGTPELWWWWGGAYSFGPSSGISGHLWPVELRPESGSCGFSVLAEFGLFFGACSTVFRNQNSTEGTRAADPTIVPKALWGRRPHKSSAEGTAEPQAPQEQCRRHCGL